MRSAKMNGYRGKFESSFLSCEKDTEAIIKKLFVDSKPYSDILKRLLIINTEDCLDDMTNQAYVDKIKSTSIVDLKEKGYLCFNKKIQREENDEVKSHLVFSFLSFTPNKENPHYRDCILMIDVLCHSDYWELGNYRQRPLKIAGYVDGILNGTRLSGIGKLDFIGCNELVLNDELSGYCLTYAATHGVDDIEEININD